MIVVATPGASVEQRGRHHGNGRGIVEGARPVDDSDEGHFRARTAEPLGRRGVEAGTVACSWVSVRRSNLVPSATPLASAKLREATISSGRDGSGSLPATRRIPKARGEPAKTMASGVGASSGRANPPTTKVMASTEDTPVRGARRPRGAGSEDEDDARDSGHEQAEGESLAPFRPEEASNPVGDRPHGVFPSRRDDGHNGESTSRRRGATTRVNGRNHVR